MRSENFVQGGMLPSFVDDLVLSTPGMTHDAVGDLSAAPVHGIYPVQAGTAASRYLFSRRKRVFDIVLASLLILGFLPLLALVALAVAVTSEGPVLFRQLRGGVHFRPFMIWKFRTMRLHDDAPHLAQAVPGDARVTPLGYILRMTSADELPQFFNVLRGDMSLIGPRPHAICHDRIYMSRIAGYAKRFQAKPGITGLAQVSGLRGGTSTDDAMQSRVDADLEYLRTASLRLDLAILLRTVVRVVACRDAY